MKTCVVVPAYNEEKAIGDLARSVRNQILEIIVIDDGSVDNTVRVAEENGALVLQNKVNQGKGASLIKGFNYALSKDFDAVICMDGDGQHSSEDIKHFLHAAENSENALFIGNRMGKTKGMPRVRILTNRFMSWFISCMVKQKIPDSQCGFRLIKKNLLEKLKLTSLRYEIESEMLIKSSRLGFTIESVPIKTVYRGEKSQINPFIDTIRFLKFIVSQLWTTRH